jgi:hypothetical protein
MVKMKHFRNYFFLKVRRKKTALIYLATFLFCLSGCSEQDPEEKLKKFVKNNEFSVPVVLLEMRGGFYTNSWFGGVLYYGYGNNGNYENCIKDAESRNKEERAVNYRCRIIK